jgi:hypothetical protein
MKESEKKRLECVQGALATLRCERDGILSKDKTNPWGLMLDTAIGHIEDITNEWVSVVTHQRVSNEMLWQELIFQRPEVKSILVKLYKQHGRTKAGRKALVDELKGLLAENES